VALRSPAWRLRGGLHVAGKVYCASAADCPAYSQGDRHWVERLQRLRLALLAWI
jgi:hypothetical protein